MNRRGILVALSLLLGLACSSESKAKSELATYESVFQQCKQMTEQQKMEPGAHPCAKVSTMALEMSMSETGVEEPRWREMAAAWAREKGFDGYYLAPGDPKR